MNTTSVSADISVDYVWWQEKATELIRPIAALMEEGQASIPFSGSASDHGENADKLESFARPFLLWAKWRYSLDVRCDEELAALNERAEAWFKSALLAGTDPDGDQFWGYSANFHQHSVEIGLLVIALEISREQFWRGFSDKEKMRVLAWLESDAGNGHHWNNHMFFGILVLEFLIREGRGRPSYRPVIDRWFHALEGMYEADGWYMDGSNQTFDFYNAYAFHYYGMWWVRFYGEANPQRCELWKKRTSLFLRDYPAFFAASGEHPAFGRSITYRFNATAPIGLGHLMETSPISPGMGRSLCTRSLKFFLEKGIYQDQGCLSIGWYDEFNGFAETYSCGASPYWSAKAFVPLLIPPEDPFWTDPEVACPAAKGDGEIVLEGPSLVVRNVDGEAELVNAGVQVACGNSRFGPHKWGRLSYKTSFGFTVPALEGAYPFDGGLTAEVSGRTEIYGRHYTAPFALDSSHMACLYSLGGKVDQSQIAVETYVWWKSDWQLVVHSIRSKSDAILRQGAYALASSNTGSITMDTENMRAFATDGQKGVVLENVLGFESTAFDTRLSEDEGPRRHIQAPYHATPLLVASINAGQDLLLASFNWAGKRLEESSPWEIEYLDTGEWAFTHPHLGNWSISNPILPKV